MRFLFRKCCFGIGRRRGGSLVRFEKEGCVGVRRQQTDSTAETKVLKQRVRDHIDPSRDLGHSDTHGKKKTEEGSEKKDGEKQGGERKVLSEGIEVKRNPDGTICEDCR